MAGSFHLTVVTLERSVFEGDVTSLVAPGTEGYFGVLVDHAPFIASLKTGKLTLRDIRGTETVYAVSGGFFEVAQNKAMLLCDAIEQECDIDVGRAERAKERALARIHSREDDVDHVRALAALSRARNRIHIYQIYSSH